jgi:hypothetical protein
LTPATSTLRTPKYGVAVDDFRQIAVIYTDTSTGLGYIHVFADALASSLVRFQMPPNMKPLSILYSTIYDVFWVAASFSDGGSSAGLTMLSFTATSVSVDRYDFVTSASLDPNPIIKLNAEGAVKYSCVQFSNGEIGYWAFDGTSKGMMSVSMASMKCLGASVTSSSALDLYGYNTAQPKILIVISITNFMSGPSTASYIQLDFSTRQYQFVQVERYSAG